MSNIKSYHTIFLFILKLLILLNSFSCDDLNDLYWATLKISEVDRLPLLPTELVKTVGTKQAADKSFNISTNTFIPRRVWIAVRNISDVRPAHYNGKEFS